MEPGKEPMEPEEVHGLSGDGVAGLINGDFTGFCTEQSRFSKAKENISTAIDNVQRHLNKSLEFMMEVDELKELIQKTDRIKEQLNEKRLKIVFFGRTSNGKSSLINAMLRENVLPVGIGHTTNCFCRLIGTNESEGYLTTPNSQEKQHVKNVQQLAHSLKAGRLDSNSLVEIYWPKSRCPLLSNDVELMDSTGIDVDDNFDRAIDENCLGADAFVFVANAESTITKAERDFLRRVSEKLAMPNVFIVNNRWDCSANMDKNEVEEVKNQHIGTGVNFLSRELSMVDQEKAKDRVFFVSAKEVLQKEDDRLNGWEDRMADFKRFEKELEQQVSIYAIRTKFEKYCEMGNKILEELKELLQDDLQCLSQENEEVERKFNDAKEKLNLLDKKIKRKHQSEKRVLTAIKAIQNEFAGAFQKFDSDMLDLIDHRFCQEDFDVNHTNGLFLYQRKVLEFLDEEKSKVLDELNEKFKKIYDEAQNHIINNNRQPRTYQHLVPLCLHFKYSDMCDELTVDPKFHFLDSVQLYRHQHPILRQLRSLISIPKIAFLATGIIVTLTVYNGMLLPVIIVGLIPVVFFGFQWIAHDPQTAVNKQIVVHAQSKTKNIWTTLCNSYTTQVERNLSYILSDLQTQLEQEIDKMETCRTKCGARLEKLAKFLLEGKKLRDCTTQVKKCLEDFKQLYLNNSI